MITILIAVIIWGITGKHAIQETPNAVYNTVLVFSILFLLGNVPEYIKTIAEYVKEKKKST